MMSDGVYTVSPEDNIDSGSAHSLGHMAEMYKLFQNLDGSKPKKKKKKKGGKKKKKFEKILASFLESHKKGKASCFRS